MNLDLLNSFDLKDLRKAYHKMVLKYHPDKAKDEAQRIEYNNKMKKLNEAYDILEKYLKTHGGRYTKPTKTNNEANTSYRKDYTSKYSDNKTAKQTYGDIVFDEDDEYRKLYAELREEIKKSQLKSDRNMIIFMIILILLSLFLVFGL